MRHLKRRLLVALTLAGSIVAVATVLVPAAAGDSTPTAAFAISGGNAVLGSPVTFWGAQWWKDNRFATGTAPPAFKGYVVAVDPIACTFTTGTGDSTVPPAGPLPPVITVLVTNSVTQSGSTVSGTIAEFALVATDDGYDSNPGHGGTGTVIGFIPCGGQL